MGEVVVMKRPHKYSLISLFILFTVFMPAIITVSGCYGDMVTIQEDGSGRSCFGYMSRGHVLRQMGSCIGSYEFSFTSEAAYQNFMAWAREEVNSISDAGTRNEYEETLRRMERERYPPGRSGVHEYPSTTTEKGFGFDGGIGGSGVGAAGAAGAAGGK
jgi:hypothetical protein